MLYLNAVGNVSSYTLDTLHVLSMDYLEKLCFVNSPCHGYVALGALYPKHVRLNKHNPLSLELKTSAAIW